MAEAEQMSSAGLAICAAEAEQRRVRMLVRVNPSEFGEPALDTATCTARLMDAEVRLVAVVPPSQEHGTAQVGERWYPSHEADSWNLTSSPLLANATSPDVSPIETRTQAIEAAQLEAYDSLREVAKRFEGLPVTMQVLFNASVAEALIEYACRSRADLIVMPTHGRGVMAQAILGSVAAEVVRSGVAPCLLVKPPA
jgi:nucleotide-binding universal stress UspA family protein